jgi:hypothetical protein
VTVHGPVNPAVPPEAALRETRAVLGRIEAGRLRPRSAFELSYAIVSALAQGQEGFVETVTRQVWPLEQRVTSGHLGDPEQFLEELFGTRHALLAVSNMAALGRPSDLSADVGPGPLHPPGLPAAGGRPGGPVRPGRRGGRRPDPPAPVRPRLSPAVPAGAWTTRSASVGSGAGTRPKARPPRAR